MKKVFAIAFGFLFLVTSQVHAVQYSSIFLSENENAYFNSIAPCVTQTIHTERIAADAEMLGGSSVYVLRNLARMVSSAEAGCDLQADKLWRAIDRVNRAVNSGQAVPVFGQSPAIMKHFTDQAAFYYNGR